MKKKIMITIIAILVIVAGVVAYMSQTNQAMEVMGSAVTSSRIEKIVEETGTIESKNHRIISANTSGKIENVAYEIGDVVKEGDLLMNFDLDASDLNIKSLQSRLSGVQSLYTQAKRTSANSKVLYEAGAVSYEEYQNALTNERQLAAQINEISYNIQQLRETKSAGLVNSPINGVITEIYVKEGENVVNGMNLIEISDIDNIYVEVELLIDDASLVKNDAKVIVKNDDIDLEIANGNYISKIYPKAHLKISDLGIEQKRIKVEITLGETELLKLGYDVDVEIIVEAKDNALIIPENSIFKLDGKEYVFIIEKDIAVQREIQTGIKNSKFIEVVSGLKEGEIVIESPQEDLEEGQPIKLVQ